MVSLIFASKCLHPASTSTDLGEAFFVESRPYMVLGRKPFRPPESLQVMSLNPQVHGGKHFGRGPESRQNTGMHFGRVCRRLYAVLKGDGTAGRLASLASTGFSDGFSDLRREVRWRAQTEVTPNGNAKALRFHARPWPLRMHRAEVFEELQGHVEGHLLSTSWDCSATRQISKVTQSHISRVSGS